MLRAQTAQAMAELLDALRRGVHVPGGGEHPTIPSGHARAVDEEARAWMPDADGAVAADGLCFRLGPGRREGGRPESDDGQQEPERSDAPRTGEAHPTVLARRYPA